MSIPNPLDFKDRILSIIKQRGPILPVHIAKEIRLSILFTSAFLSELISEKEIKISYMRVGNSPIHFVSGQEPKLESFSQYLDSKEKEAFLLLKEKKFLKDREQEPAIRVAMRAIKDFAIPFKKDEEIYWRYFIIPETDFQTEKPKPVEAKTKKIEEEISKETAEKRKEKEETKKEIPKEKIIQKRVGANRVVGRGKDSQKTKDLEIFEKSKIKKIPESVSEISDTETEREKEKKSPQKKKISKKQNETFFNKIKDALTKQEIEILDILNFNKDELILRVKNKLKDELIVAYNKKRITEDDLIKASRKASELNLEYSIFSFGEIPRKLREILIATKNLSKIEKVE